MKLQQLIIKNIASLEHAEIDFENSAIAENSVFLICGDTGAGKTTILDAICLALYNNTPRFRQATSGRYINRVGNQTEDLDVNNVYQLMRRNTAEASVELYFMDDENNRYLAQWYIKRARLKNTGALQKVQWSLTDLKTHQTWNGPKSVLPEVHRVVGLDFEQFCRTTLLAQGDFTKFLRSDDNEKTQILEKLTGTDIYTKIGTKIHELTRQKKNLFDSRNIEISSIQPLTDDQKSQLNTEIEASTVELQSLIIQYSELDKKRQWLTDEKSALDAQKGLMDEYKMHQQIAQSDDFKAMVKKINDWHLSSEARLALIELIKETKKQTENKIQEKKLRDGFYQLCNGYKYLNDTTASYKISLHAIDQFLLNNETYQSMYQQGGLIVNHLKASCQFALRVADLLREKEMLSKDIPAFNKTLKQFQKTNDDLHAKSVTLQENINLKEQELKLLDVEKMYVEQQRIVHSMQLLSELKSSSDRLNDKLIALKSTQEENLSLRQQYEKLLLETSTFENDQKLKDRLYSNAKLLYDKIEIGTKSSVQEIRHQLTLGDHCPVCGHIIDEVIKDDKFISQLKPLREDLDSKWNEKQTSEIALKTHQFNIKSLKDRVDLSNLNLTNIGSEYREQENIVKKYCQDAQIEFDLEAMHSVLILKNEENNALAQKVQLKIKQANAVQNSINELYNHRNELQKQQEEAKAKIQTTQKEIDGLLFKVATKDELIKDTLHHKDLSFDAAKQLIRWDENEWLELWNNTPELFINKLQEASDFYISQINQKARLETDLQKMLTEISNTKASLINIYEIFPHWKNEIHLESIELPDIVTFGSTLKTEINLLKQSIDNANHVIENSNRLLNDFYQENSDFTESYLMQLIHYQTIREDEAKQIEKQDSMNRIEGGINLLKEQLDKLYSIKPTMNENENINSISLLLEELDQKKQSLNRSIGEKSNQLKIDEQKNSLIRDKLIELEKIKKEYQLWDELRQDFGGNDGKEFRKIAQSFVLNHLLQGANQYLRQFTERYSLECQPGSLTILVRDLYQASLGGVSNLSGGESFLVSLSLALGLSSLNQSGFSVDILFIDEGFGTLSAEYLNTVMDALERLHELNGKKVGIISHMEGLRERIKTQIQVKRIDNSRSEILIV